LAALPAVVLDLETTGLDVTRERVVQVGAVTMAGAKILEEPRLDQLTNPGMPIPPSATRIHGISDRDVAGAPDFAAVAPALQEIMSGRVVIGHNTAFDLAILRHEAARAGIPWQEPGRSISCSWPGRLSPRCPISRWKR